MDLDDIYPRFKLDDDEDYKIEVKEKKSFIKKIMTRVKSNMKMLPSPNDRNFQETNISIKTMWRFGNVKSFITQKMEYMHNIVSLPKKVDQKNVEIQVIGKNNIIKNISTATKKMTLIKPIIPKNEEKNI